MEDEFPMLGALPPDQAAGKLRELGEYEAASLLDGDGVPLTRHGLSGTRELLKWPFQDRPWQYTAHAFGYIAPTSTQAMTLPQSSSPATYRLTKR